MKLFVLHDLILAREKSSIAVRIKAIVFRAAYGSIFRVALFSKTCLSFTLKLDLKYLFQHIPLQAYFNDGPDESAIFTTKAFYLIHKLITKLSD